MKSGILHPQGASQNSSNNLSFAGSAGYTSGTQVPKS